MSDIETWLNAQLDEDERLARAAGADTELSWHRDERYVAADRTHVDSDDEDLVLHIAMDGTPSAMEHIARHNPARVLAEVEAKRLMLDLHRECTGACYVVRVLALPYAGRDGYREEWRP